MFSSAARFPRLVVLPPAYSASEGIVSRPLTRQRAAGTRAYPWVAVATGFQGHAWALAERTRSLPKLRALLDQAHEAARNVQYTWYPEQMAGLLRKRPRVLRAVVGPAGFEDLGPNLLGNLALTLLLHNDALFAAADLLGSASLMALIRGPSDLLVTAGGVTDFGASRNLYGLGGLAPGAPEEVIYHLELSAFTKGFIVGEMFREGPGHSYSLASQEPGAWFLGNETEHEGPQLDAYQMEVLRALHQRGPGTYREIDMRTTLATDYTDRRIPTEVKRLKDLGLVYTTKEPGKGERWALTSKGLRAVGASDEADIVQAEVEQMLNAMRQGFQPGLMAAMSFRESLGRLPLVLLWAAQIDPSVTVNAVTLIMALDRGSLRDSLLEHLLEDERAEVRAGVFKALAPYRATKPGEGESLLEPPKLAELVGRGLTDPDARVRGFAAKTALGANCAGPFADLIVQHLESQRGVSTASAGAFRTASASAQRDDEDEERLDYWAVLSLACANDPRSLAFVTQLIDGPDDLLAGAAVRALALRADGHSAWFKVFLHQKKDLRDTALYALRDLVTGLSPADIAWLQSQRLEGLAESLEAYGRRTSQAPK